MRISTGILAIIILLSEFNVETYGLDGIDKRHQVSSFQILNRRRLNDDSSFLSKRATTATQKCSSIKSGIYYAGDTGPSIDNTNTFQDCLNLCENDKICYGWQYKNSTKSCVLQTSIGTVYTDASYMAGSCIGPAAKQVTCTESLSNTYYNGDSNPAIKNVASSKICMSKCDADPTCLGWSYRSKDTTCWTQTSVYGQVTDAQYTSGSCITPQAPYPPISIDTYRQQALAEHNAHRKKHCTGSVALDSELNDIAQKYAEKLAATKTFQHSGNTFHGNYLGENIYMMSGLSRPMYAKGSEPVAYWYTEMESYDWSKPGFGSDTGHFTQLVWDDTTSFGIGRALSSDNSSLYVVANYYPAGNMGDEFSENVLKLC